MNSEICNILREINYNLQAINNNLYQLNQNQQTCNQINQRTSDANSMFINRQMPIMDKNEQIIDFQLDQIKGVMNNENQGTNK